MDVQPFTKSYQLHEEGEGERGETTPWQGLCPWITLGSPPLSPSYRIYGWMTLTKMWVPICLYCSNCTKFGQLILRKIIEIVATRCQILRLKCTKFDYGWGSAPDPAGGAYSAPANPLAGFGGPTSKGRGRRGERREGEGKGERRRGEGRIGEGKKGA